MICFRTARILSQHEKSHGDEFLWLAFLFHEAHKEKARSASNANGPFDEGLLAMFPLTSNKSLYTKLLFSQTKNLPTSSAISINAVKENAWKTFLVGSLA